MSTLGAHPLRQLARSCASSSRRRPAGARPRARSCASPTSGSCSLGSGSATTRRRATSKLTREMIVAGEADESRDAMGVLLGLDLTDDLPRIHLPTLVLGGTADVAHPAGRIPTDRGADPGRPPRGVQGAGHMLMYERTDEVDQLIIDFARTLGVGSPFRRFWPRRSRRRPGTGRGRQRSVAREAAPDHRRARRPRRALDRWRNRRHRGRVPTGDGGVGRGARRCARDPRDRAARPVPARRARRRDRVHRGFGVRPGRRRRRDAGARGAGPRLPVARRAGADRPARGDLRPRRVRRRSGPGPAEGEAALAAARVGRARSRPGGWAPARGATVGKWRGARPRRPGASELPRRRSTATSSSARSRSSTRSATSSAADGTVLVGSAAPPEGPGSPIRCAVRSRASNTTLVVVATNARLHEGRVPPARPQRPRRARPGAIHPSHTRHDGDLAFVLATGAVRRPRRPAARRWPPTWRPRRSASAVA